MKNRYLKRLFVFVATSIFFGCGVKGRPLPPLKGPPILGTDKEDSLVEKKKDKKNSKEETKVEIKNDTNKEDGAH